MLRFLTELPHIECLNDLRGLRDVKLSWHATEGLQGMHHWACAMIGVWRLQKGMSYWLGDQVEAPEMKVEDSDVHYVHWIA